MKTRFYSLKNILEKDAQYNIIFGHRSTGKTYSVLEYAVKKFCADGEQLAVVRRFADDFKNKRGATLFDNLCANDAIRKHSRGEWSYIKFTSQRWYMARKDENGKEEVCEKPIAFAFSLSTEEHDKSSAYPDVTTVLFDEFISRDGYFDDEFILFMNLLSTIIRHRTNVKIFLCGNTINRFNPYFSEFGLRHAKEMKPNTIDVYTYGDTRLRVAVEFTGNDVKNADTNSYYFAFDNPKLNMITGNGDLWEIATYPHAPCKWCQKDVLFNFFIKFADNLLQCDVVSTDHLLFIFIHRKTTPLRKPDKDLIYSTEYSARPNWRRKITVATTPCEKRINELLALEKVYFQDNDTGDVFFNYMNWCRQ